MDTSRFSKAVQELFARMNPCVLCPRRCKVNRSQGEVGFCGIGALPVISSVGPHFGEESVLVGNGGSGTIFFAGCNLGCIFCQNFDISHYRHGEIFTIEQLCSAMLSLQDAGCVNINFVTPTHSAASIAAAIEIARAKGLRLPTVYNTGGYDSVESLRLLDGLIDIYMPDMKYSDSRVAVELCDAGDYPEVNRSAIRHMHSQVGDLKIEKGLAVGGLLVRHLVLPNRMAGSFKTIDFLAEQISPDTAINVMEQYHPCFKAFSHSKINRRCTKQEYESVRGYAAEKGLMVIC